MKNKNKQTKGDYTPPVTDPGSEAPGVTTVVIEPVQETFSAEINDIIPFPLKTQRNREFYASLSDDSFQALLEVVRVSTSLFDAIKDPDSPQPFIMRQNLSSDPIWPMASNIVNTLHQGLTHMSHVPALCPEEIELAATVINLAVMLDGVDQSEIYPILSKLASAHRAFASLEPALPLTPCRNFSN